MNRLPKHILVMLFICTSCTAFAQRHIRVMPDQPYERHFDNHGNHMQNSGMRRIQAVKEGFISRQLNLRPEQAEKFWPLYRQYQSEVWNIRRLKRLNNSDAQANGSEQINKDLDYDTQLVNLRKHYNEEFLKILPPEKVSELYKSEREFTDELIKQVHEHGATTPD